MDKKWIVADSGHLGGKLRVRGTRISVSHLLEMFACGMTIPEIIDAYPSLSQEAIKGTLEELAKTHEEIAA
jgi:uncharacterized protein (DUF433 family)